MNRRLKLPPLLLPVLGVLLLIGVLVFIAGGLPTSDALKAAAPTVTSTPTKATAPPTSEAGPTSSSPTSASGKKSGKKKDKATAEKEPMSQAAITARPGQGPLPSDQEIACPAATVSVSSASELTAALGAAKAGDVVHMKDGIYAGNFSARSSGTAANRIYLCGGPGAVLDGGDTKKGYVFHLDGASYWVLAGFTARNGQKGIVTDSSNGSVIENLTMTNIGDEGIHLRNNSSSNLVIGNLVGHTGSNNAKFGEGIYVGSAVSNWCTYSNCHADASNYNIIAGNTVSNTTAENIDIKEGTVGGVIKNNHFDGIGMTAATAWINVKGNAWTIEGNDGKNSPKDGFQTHNILQQWGDNNLFVNNSGSVNGPGYAFAATPVMHNIIACANAVTGAGRGTSNIPCTTP